MASGTDVRSVLVTGAAGFVGSAVAQMLSAAGMCVRAIDSSAGALPPNSNVLWTRADLRDADWIKGLGDVEAIVHCAAAVPASMVDSSREADINRRIDDAVLSLMVERRLPLVYASSTSVYGIPPIRRGRAIRETDPPCPPGPYSKAKIRAEMRGREQAERIGVGFASLRICAPYGPHQRQRTVMHLFIERAIAGQTLLYHGTGAREQSFTYIDDVARAFRLAIGRSGAFNIAASEPVTTRRLAECIAGLTGLDPALVRPSGQPDPQEGATSRFDTSAAAEGLGWRAATPLTLGVGRCIHARRNETATQPVRTGD